MPTTVKGDRESLQTFVRQTLDQAFSARVTAIFSMLCTDFEMEQVEQGETIFIRKFKLAVAAWNAATAAVAEEYPK